MYVFHIVSDRDIVQPLTPTPNPMSSEPSPIFLLAEVETRLAEVGARLDLLDAKFSALTSALAEMLAWQKAFAQTFATLKTKTSADARAVVETLERAAEVNHDLEHKRLLIEIQIAQKEAEAASRAAHAPPLALSPAAA